MTKWLIANNKEHKNYLKTIYPYEIFTKKEFFTYLLKHFLDITFHDDNAEIFIIAENFISLNKYPISITNLLKAYDDFNYHKELNNTLLNFCLLFDEELKQKNIIIFSKALNSLCKYLDLEKIKPLNIANISYINLLDLNLLEAKIIKSLAAQKVNSQVYFPLNFVNEQNLKLHYLISFFEADSENDYLELVFEPLLNNQELSLLINNLMSNEQVLINENFVSVTYEHTLYKEYLQLAKKVKYLKQKNPSDTIAIFIDDPQKVLLIKQSLLDCEVYFNHTASNLANTPYFYLLMTFLNIKRLSAKKYLILLLDNNLFIKKNDIININYQNIFSEVGFIPDDNNYINNLIAKLEKFKNFYEQKSHIDILIETLCYIKKALELFNDEDYLYNHVNNTIIAVKNICTYEDKNLQDLLNLNINNKKSFNYYCNFLQDYFTNININNNCDNIEFLPLNNNFKCFDHIFLPNMMIEQNINSLLLSNLIAHTKKSIHFSAHLYDHNFKEQAYNQFFAWLKDNIIYSEKYLSSNNNISLLEKKYNNNLENKHKFLVNNLLIQKAFLRKSLTATFIESFSQCAYAGFLRSILHLSSSKETIDPKKRYLGEIAHKVLEIFFKDKYKLKDLDLLIDNVAKEFISKYYFPHEELLLNLLDELKTSLANLIQELQKLPYENIALEKALGVGKHQVFSCVSHNNNDYNLGGIIDRIDKFDKKYIIIDYKLSSISSIKNSITKKNIFHTHFQIPIYIQLVKDYTGCSYDDILVIFASIKDGKLLTAIDPTTYQDMFLQLNNHSLGEYIDNIFFPIKTGNIKAVASEYCKSCNFSNICKVKD